MTHELPNIPLRYLTDAAQTFVDEAKERSKIPLLNSTFTWPQLAQAASGISGVSISKTGPMLILGKVFLSFKEGDFEEGVAPNTLSVSHGLARVSQKPTVLTTLAFNYIPVYSEVSPAGALRPEHEPKMLEIGAALAKLLGLPSLEVRLGMNLCVGITDLEWLPKGCPPPPSEIMTYDEYEERKDLHVNRVAASGSPTHPFTYVRRH